MQYASNREKIELCIKINDDNFNEKCFLCKVFQKNSQGYFGTTEVLGNNLATVTVAIDFTFEIKQELRLEISEGSDNHILNTTLGEILGSLDQTFEKQFTPTTTLIIKWKKVLIQDKLIFWQWRGIKIKNVDGWFGKSDPFLRFFKQAGKDWQLVYQTEFCKNQDNPNWVPFEISKAQLNDGKDSQNIKVECWDNETNGKHKFIGETLFTIEQIQKFQLKKFASLSKKGNNHGTLEIISFEIIQKSTFPDYIKQGLQIKLMIAVDFTGSNGDPKCPNSLHYYHPNNQYQQAILQFSEVFLNFNHNKEISLYGFGGIPKFQNYSKNEVDHCFPLTGNQSYVKGIDGVMKTYREALNCIQFAGPTCFAPAIQKACSMAQNDIKNYTVLLILTDGETHDASQSIQLIRSASKIPLSIIIIGVGSESFTQMQALETNKMKNSFQRNQVQFALFKNAEQVRKVLAEIPVQIMAFQQIIGQGQ